MYYLYLLLAKAEHKIMCGNVEMWISPHFPSMVNGSNQARRKSNR